MILISLVDDNKFNKMSAIAEFVQKLEVNNEKKLSMTFERNFLDILSIFLNRSLSRIVYILYNVGASSSWELYNHFNAMAYQKKLNMNLCWLETKNIVDEIYDDSEEDKAIRKVWNRLYPNGIRSYSKTKLFKLSDGFRPVFDLFLDDIYRKYIFQSDYVKIERRKIAYCKIYNQDGIEKKSKEKLEKNCIGFCLKCKKAIQKDSGDHMKLFDGVVHNRCYLKSTQREILKWRHKNK